MLKEMINNIIQHQYHFSVFNQLAAFNVAVKFEN